MANYCNGIIRAEGAKFSKIKRIKLVSIGKNSRDRPLTAVPNPPPVRVRK